MDRRAPRTLAVARGAARRALVHASVDRAARLLVLAGGAAAALAGADRLALVNLGSRTGLIGAALGAGVFAGAGAWAWIERWSPQRGARALDTALGLADRLGSGLALSAKGAATGFELWAIDEAERAASSVARATASRARPRGWWAIGPALVALAWALVAYVPRWTPRDPAADAATSARAQALAELELAAAALRASADDATASDIDAAASATAEDLADLEDLARELREGALSPTDARAEAARALAERAETLEEQARVHDAARDEARRTVEAAQTTAGPEPAFEARSEASADAATEIAKALQREDWSGAAEQLDALAQRLPEMPAEERAAALDALRDLAERLEAAEHTAPSQPEPSLPAEALPEPPPPADATPTPSPQPEPGEPTEGGDAIPGRPEPPAGPRAETSDRVPPSPTPPEPTETNPASNPPADAREQPEAPSQPTPPADPSPDPAEGKPPERPTTSEQQNAQEDSPTTPQERPADQPSQSQQEGRPPSDRPTVGETPPAGGHPTPDQHQPGQPNDGPPQPAEPRPDPGAGAAQPPTSSTPSPSPTPSAGAPEGAAQDNAAQDNAAPTNVTPERSDPARTTPGEPAGAPRDAPTTTAPTTNDPQPNAAPGRNPPSSAPEGEAIDELRRRLEQYQERARESEALRRRAQQLREHADRLLEPGAGTPLPGPPEARAPSGAPDGSSDREAGPGTGPEPRSPPGPGAETAPTVGAPMREGDVFAPGAAWSGQGRTVAEWYNPDAPAQGGTALSPAEELGAAQQAAQRAIDEQLVPPSRRDYVRRVFERLRRSAEAPADGRPAPEPPR